jgi:hypothetical membrane protein
MKLRYETGTGTLIQLIVLGLLNIATALDSIIATCRHDGSNCVENLLTSVIYYILLVGWFGVLVVIGFGAQDRRSKRLAQLLIAAEALVALVAFFNLRHGFHTSSFIGNFTSLVDVVLAVWVITLAWRLMRAGGGRVVSHGRTGHRRRRRHEG